MVFLSQQDMRIFRESLDELIRFYSRHLVSDSDEKALDETRDFLQDLFTKWKKKRYLKVVWKKFKQSEDSSSLYSEASKGEYTYLLSIEIGSYLSIDIESGRRWRRKKRKREIIAFTYMLVVSEKLFRGLTRISPYKKAERRAEIIKAVAIKNIRTDNKFAEIIAEWIIGTGIRPDDLEEVEGWLIGCIYAKGVLMAKKSTMLIPLAPIALWNHSEEYNMRLETIKHIKCSELA